MMRRGVRNGAGEDRDGLDGLLLRLQALKEDTLGRYDLGSVLDEIGEALWSVVEVERNELQRRLNDLVQRPTGPRDDRLLSQRQQAKLLSSAERKLRQALVFLEGLPRATSQVIKKLQHYDFTSDDSRKRFNALLRSMQQQALESIFGGLPNKVGALGQEEARQLLDMLRSLNDVLEGRSNFDEFMVRHKAFLGQGCPHSLEELKDLLIERWHLMDVLRRSLPSRLRRELDRTVEAALEHLGLQEEVARFTDIMRRLGALPEPLHFCGEEPLGLDEALEQIGRLHEIDRLGGQLRNAMESGQLDGIDRALLGRLLGQPAISRVEWLARVASSLEDTGYVARAGARFQLTPKGIRALGENALREVFSRGGGAVFGVHPTQVSGTGGDLLEETRPYMPGDYLDVDLQGSLANAMRRGVSIPLKLERDDLEVRLREQTSRAATVLLLDLSLSMAMRGNFPAAKKVAMALEALIRTRYPQDALRVVGFSTHAREIPLDQLPFLTWDEKDAFTNLQGALSLARRLLARMSADSRQIILVSDGEPTAHTEGERVVCNFPPSALTVEETIREVRRCTRQHITVNVFMLDNNARLARFVEQMAMANRGRAFFTSPDKLGRYLLVDYVAGRRKVVGQHPSTFPARVKG